MPPYYKAASYAFHLCHINMFCLNEQHLLSSFLKESHHRKSELLLMITSFCLKSKLNQISHIKTGFFTWLSCVDVHCVHWKVLSTECELFADILSWNSILSASLPIYNYSRYGWVDYRMPEVLLAVFFFVVVVIFFKSLQTSDSFAKMLVQKPLFLASPHSVPRDRNTKE